MPPGEHLDGTTTERAHLQLLLACFRASPPPMRLPEVTGRPLPEVLAARIIDPEVFRTGYAIIATRYEQLGIQLVFTAVPKDQGALSMFDRTIALARRSRPSSTEKVVILVNTEREVTDLLLVQKDVLGVLGEWLPWTSQMNWVQLF